MAFRDLHDKFIGRLHQTAFLAASSSRNVMTTRVPSLLGKQLTISPQSVDRSAFLAEVIATHIGRSDLVRHLNTAVLQLAI